MKRTSLIRVLHNNGFTDTDESITTQGEPKMNQYTKMTRAKNIADKVKPIVRSAILVSMLTMVVSGIPRVLADESLQIAPAAEQVEAEYCEYLSGDATPKIKGFSVAATPVTACQELKSCVVMVQGKAQRYSGCITVISNNGISCRSRCKKSCKKVSRPGTITINRG